MERGLYCVFFHIMLQKTQGSRLHIGYSDQATGYISLEFVNVVK
jgi:hypothetical protein